MEVSVRDYRPLPAQTLSGHVTVSRPDPPQAATVDSPALDVMTDLKRVHAAVIEPQASMESANDYMIQRGVRLLLVMRHDKSLTGLITANDIQDEKPMRIVQERGIKHSEILVSDVMTRVDDLEAIAMDEVRSARAGHIIASLKGTGRHHALAIEIDAPGGRATVRGIFSLSQIARQLGVAIYTTEVAKNFAEIEAMPRANSALG
jgi:flagellar biosynthesis/type III secretory pathway ATPase